MKDIIEETNILILEKLIEGCIDFIDAGCGVGGSIDYCQKKFGYDIGIGFDLNSSKISQAQENGYLVFNEDILKLDFPEKSVVFSSMMDFLEHLPDQASAKTIIQRLGNVSRDFLFIRHPNFDDISFLSTYGLKLTWTDWTGHKNMMTVADFCSIFFELNWNDYRIIPRRLIKNSYDESIIPASAPPNTQKYSDLVGFNKEFISFNKPIYYQYDIFVKLNSNISNSEWNKITGATK